MTDLLLSPNTEQETRKALAAIAHHGRNRQERRDFCEALGFIPTIPAHPQARDDTGRMKSRRSR